MHAFCVPFNDVARGDKLWPIFPLYSWRDKLWFLLPILWRYRKWDIYLTIPHLNIILSSSIPEVNMTFTSFSKPWLGFVCKCNENKCCTLFLSSKTWLGFACKWKQILHFDYVGHQVYYYMRNAIYHEAAGRAECCHSSDSNKPDIQESNV